MKKILLFCLSALTIVSCSKSDNEVTPSSLPAAISFTALNIKTSPQVVKLTVNASTLNVVYNEDLTLVLDSDKLAKNVAVHLKEDFSGTTLANFTNQSITQSGVNTTSNLDDILKNIMVQSSKDTLIAGKLFVKKRIVRSFNYQKVYNSAEDANTALSQLTKQTDIIAFSAFYEAENTVTAPTSNTAKLSYIKI